MNRTLRKKERRSECPISYALDILGDRWTLLVVRDMLLKGNRYFKEFLASCDGIATNILADRLARLEADGIVRKSRDPENRTRRVYCITRRGADLLPLLIEIVVWSGAHDANTVVSPEYLERLRNDRAGVLAEMQKSLDVVE